MSTKSMAKPGRLGKRKTTGESDAPSVLTYFKRTKEESSKSVVRALIDELVSSAVEKGEKSTKKHTGDSVSTKTVDSWKSKYEWLVVSGEGENTSLKCKICTKQGIRTIWAEEGSTNIQVNSVKRHSNSKEHRKAEEETSKPTTCSFVESDNDEQETQVSESDKCLFRTVFYAAQSEIPSSQVNNLLQLQRLNGVNIEYQNLSWDTVTEIQSCIGKVFEKEVIEEIKNSDVYAIMIDESTDLALHKHLSVCVRYVKDGEPVTKFLANVALLDGKAHTIVHELIECLKKLGLTADKMVSLATDGASTMTGRKTGVGVQLKSKHSPFVIQTHCIAHRLNLAVTDSIKKDETLIKFKEMFSGLYHFMSGSSNRTIKLQKIQNLLHEPTLTIKEPYSIRWLGLKNAVEAVFESYTSISATLAHFAAEKNPTANGLLKYFIQYRTVMLVAFMLDVHEVLGILSKEFQKENIAFSEINPLVEATVGKLDFLETNDGTAMKTMRQSIEIKAEDGSQVAYLKGEKLSRYTAESDTSLLSLRSRYIERLRKNIKHRFKQDDSDMIKNLSTLLEPAIVNTTSAGEHEEALKEVSRLFGEDTVVKRVYGDMLHQDEMTEEVIPVQKLLDKEKLVQEWPMLRGMISGSYSKKNTQSLCKRVLLLHRDALPEFSKLCTIALCVSVSSVACERSFSTQNRLKNKYRTSLKTENLNILIQIQMAGKDLSNYDPSKAVKLWTAKKRRRKARLVQQYKPRVVAKSADATSLCLPCA